MRKVIYYESLGQSSIMLWAKIVPLSHTPHRPSNEGDQDPIPLALHTQNYDAKDREEFEDANDHVNCCHQLSLLYDSIIYWILIKYY
ncbi:hypothetical protein P8452_05440 [Trifolium repens]|nr:hypothetical protein P8452_05440 [Trifolium repens]